MSGQKRTNRASLAPIRARAPLGGLAIALLTSLASLGASTPAQAHDLSVHVQVGGAPVAPTGRLGVDNDAGTTLTLRVDGRMLATLRPGEERALTVGAGVHQVQASYVQLGVERTVLATQIRVEPGRRREIHLPAAVDTLMAVRNPLDRSVRLRVDGMDRGALGAFGSTRVAVAPGPHTVELVLDGRSVARETEYTQIYADNRWDPRVAMIGDLVVRNPLPIPVTLVAANGQARTVQAYGSTTFAGVGQGGFPLSVRRADGGEVVAQLLPQVRAFVTTVAEVTPPRMGVVAVQSVARSSTRVFVDGRFLAALSPGTFQRLELTPGMHQVQVIDDRGRTLELRSLRIDRYDVAMLRVEGRDQDGGHQYADRGEDRGEGRGYGDGNRDEDRSGNDGWHVRPEDSLARRDRED